MNITDGGRLVVSQSHFLVATAREGPEDDQRWFVPVSYKIGQSGSIQTLELKDVLFLPFPLNSPFLIAVTPFLCDLLLISLSSKRAV